uniref:putative F-box/LRR-repeat protein 23 n=1 Tax=Erigeron canadensis TaxID=72917 RepID=UPI001CB965CC|nr:putative F-box/LRR-repeat protein 23 [Erigeron canadensis]
MPHELMSVILQKLGVVEILNNAQKVCTYWRIVCKDPAMWKVINFPPDCLELNDWDMLLNLYKQAVFRSSGELIDIKLESLCNDDLLDFISQRSSKLKCLSLSSCYAVTSSGLSHAAKRLPHLEQLHLFYTSIDAEDIEVIGTNCPQLKSFKLNKEFRRPHIECDGDALAIANAMPELRHLQLFGNKMTNAGLEAILHGCPHLEFLDVRRCFNLDLGGSLGKLCMERIRFFMCPNDPTENCGFNPRAHAYDDFDDMYSSGNSDVDEFSGDDSYNDYEFSDGSVISEEDDYDYYD